MFIDIHTHQKKSDSNIKKHFNVIVKSDFEMPNYPDISVGIHPWYIENFEDQLGVLENLVVLENVKMIGECGLDKINGADWAMQEKVFYKANKNGRIS